MKKDTCTHTPIYNITRRKKEMHFLKTRFLTVNIFYIMQDLINLLHGTHPFNTKAK